MNKFFKRASAGLLAAIFAATTFTADVPTAQAFKLGDIADGLGDIIGIGGKGGKSGDLTSSRDKMLENYYYSIALLDAAYQNVLTATDAGIANKNIISTEQAAKSAVKSNDAGTNMKNGADQKRQQAEAAKKALADAVASGDEEKLKQIDEFIKTANNQRLTSNVMAGVASAQAGMIIASSAKNIATGNLDNLGDIVNVAKDVEGVLKLRNEAAKLLDTATKEYRKTRGIKDPGKKEQKAAADAIEKG